MKSQTNKANHNTSATDRSVANDISDSQKEIKPIFQFTDNRPESLLQRKLQQTANDSPQAVAQRRTISGLSSGGAIDAVNTVYLGDGILAMDSLWEMPVITKADRATLLVAIAKLAGEIGNEIDGKINPQGWNYNSDARGNYDPIRVRYRGRYGPEDNRQNLTLDYHYGSSFSGYVIHVTDTGSGVDKEMHNPDSELDLDPDTEYSHIHHIDGAPAGPLEQAGGADNITKIVGEGARWQSIGQNAGSIQDNTKIFTNQNADKSLSPRVRFVLFPNLWKSWKETFNKAYGILDTTVAGKLENPNIQITTGDGIQNSPVGVANSNAMHHGRDISVDPQKPTEQADLNLNAVSYLHFKKSGTVIESDNTYAEEETAASAAVDAIPGITLLGHGSYVGNQEFAFLCRKTDVADPTTIAGYTYQGPKSLELTFPAYRAPAMLPLAKNTATGPAIGTGQTHYTTEKRARYNTLVKELVEEVEGCEYEIEAISQINVEDFVRDSLVPWTDINAQLPALFYQYDRFEDLAGFYRPLIEAYSEELAAQREAEFEAEVDRLVAEVPYFGAKSRADQNRIRSEIQERVRNGEA